MTVQNILSEPLEIHGRGNGRSRLELVKGLMRAIGLDERYLQRYPHSFSGGQRQRIGIARALALRPRPADLRRAGFGARRLGAGADPQPAQGSAEGARAHLSVHFAQSGGRRLHGRPHRGDVPRPHRRACAARDAAAGSPSIPIRSRCLPQCRFPISTGRSTSRRCRRGGASDSSAWGPQFRDDGEDDALSQTDLGGGHLVLARRSVDARELRP